MNVAESDELGRAFAAEMRAQPHLRPCGTRHDREIETTPMILMIPRRCARLRKSGATYQAFGRGRPTAKRTERTLHTRRSEW
jgi:hypothetical protein